MNSRQRRTFARKHSIQRTNFIFSSCGNDSVALMQYVKEWYPNDNNIVVYSDTGWAADFWYGRVRTVRAHAKKIGFKFAVTESEGMEALVRRKKGWPMAASEMQFCTNYLKIQPAIKYMNSVDDFGLPHFRTRCFTGVRREESQNRKNALALLKNSERHGGRNLHSPLVEFGEGERNELINKTGIPVLEHQSMECFPCICSNRSDFRKLSIYPDRIKEVAKIEREMGYTSKGNPRVMFRPYRHMGAIGIEEVVKWGMAERGKYKLPEAMRKIKEAKENKKNGHIDTFIENETLPCNSGFCGF